MKKKGMSAIKLEIKGSQQVSKIKDLTQPFKQLNHFDSQ